MPIVKQNIKSAIKSAVTNNEVTGSEESIDKFADDLAKIIVDAIKSADVVINAATILTTVTTPAGAGTGVGSADATGYLK